MTEPTTQSSAHAKDRARNTDSAGGPPRAIPEQGQVWRYCYVSGAHVAVREVDGQRVRLVDVTVTPQGAVALTASRSRWATIGRFTSAYRLTEHRLDRVNVPEPKVGQLWVDNDPRGYGRRVRIVEIDETHAVVELHQPCQPVSSARPCRRTRIRLDRFRPTSTGYRYVGDA